MRVVLHAHSYPSNEHPSKVVSPENPAGRWDKLTKWLRRTSGEHSRRQHHLLHHKGPDILLDSFAQVASDLPVELAMIGPGDPNELAEQSAASSDTGRILRPGEMTQLELVAWYQLADVFVLPSRREAFG